MDHGFNLSEFLHRERGSDSLSGSVAEELLESEPATNYRSDLPHWSEVYLRFHPERRGT